MATTINSINPTTTYEAYAPSFRGENQNVYVTPALAASGTAVLPKIDTFPATFLVTCQGDSVANSRHGFVTALSASVVVAQGTNVSTTAAAQTIVPSISSGVITLTANATFGGGTTPVYVTRVS